MKESDIMHETPCGKYWVGRNASKKAYVVYRNKGYYSESDSAYHMTPDGLSIAITYADYLAKRLAQGAIS